MRSIYSSLAAALGVFLTVGAARCATIAEIPFEFRDGYLWVNVAVEGRPQPLNFLFDTGAESSVIDSATAKRVGLKLGWPRSVKGVHSEATAYHVGRVDAQVAGIPIPKSLLALDLKAVSDTCHQPIDGLLGLDFLKKRVVQIDYAAKKIRILDGASTCVDSEILPIKVCNNALCVPVSIGGCSSQWMRVDTGCDSALEWVVRKGNARGGATSIGLSNAQGCSIFTEVQLGGRGLGKVKTGLHGSEIFPGESGLLGNALLSQFRVTLDIPGRRFILE